MASVSGADAKGCIKGAIVGDVAGHMAGHGKIGAAAACVIGHPEANKPDPNNANAQAPSQKRPIRRRDDTVVRDEYPFALGKPHRRA
jgi:hypothetical protein